MFTSRPPPFSKKTPVVSTSTVPNAASSETLLEKPRSRATTFFSRSTTFVSKLSFRNQAPPTWQPNALRPSVLIFSTAVSLSLIAVLVYLLKVSQHDQGIQFAPKISELPLSKTFMWQYFPIILAVVFSIFWAWIDLETKRLEPYYQLSKKEGALGKDSLLLRYPFDFLPLVPITALKARHWPVFFASFSVVIVSWGIVPVQSGIFSTTTVTRTFPSRFEVSTNFIPASQQEERITTRYAQSAYGIVMLNETLSPYTTRDYILAPFRSLDAESQRIGNWTAPTTLYSLDMQCEEATATVKVDSPQSTVTVYNSTSGCSFELPPLGNQTVGLPPPLLHLLPNASAGIWNTKEFSAVYVGYSGANGFADYYLDYSCPKAANHTFLAVFARNKKREEDAPSNTTNIYCQPIYYSQAVNATVDVATKRPLEVVPSGAKVSLAPNLFNTSVLEATMNGAVARVNVRGNTIPTTSLPNYLDHLAETNLSMWDVGTIQPLAAMAALAGDLPLEEYTNPKTLGLSYEKAYRLLFINSMVDVLADNFVESEQVDGQYDRKFEAVVLDQVFTYVVEGLLGVVSLATIALLYLSLTRERNLRADPSTIASVMSLVADNKSLLSDLQDMDCCTMEEVDRTLRNRRWKLVNDATQTGIVEIGQVPNSDLPSVGDRQNTPKEIAKPIRPIEFRLFVAIPFVGFFVVLATSLAILFIKAQNGLPIPSKSKIVENILENYIPTAIATLIEPMWVLINRLLCMLQPLEELQGCKAPADKSISLNYNSLPPQLVVFKALRSRHFVLSAVCTMALLANILAIAFAGLFRQDSREIWTATSFPQPFQPVFVSINGSMGPGSAERGSLVASGAYAGGRGQDALLIAESNYTKGTPLPAWTDETMMYLPFTSSVKTDKTDVQYEARTTTLGAALDCEKLYYGADYRADINTTSMTLEMSASKGPCFGSNSYHQGLSAGAPIECSSGPSAIEFVTQLHARENVTKAERDMCMTSVVLSWVRDPIGTCGGTRNITLDGTNSLFVRCQPRIVTGYADVRVDAEGYLQGKAGPARMTSDDKTDELKELVQQSNLYLLPVNVGTWHNDTFASDNLNYFATRENNSSRLVDPNQMPALDDVSNYVETAYSKLFSIWLGANKERLLVPAKEGEGSFVTGWTVTTTDRLFLSTTMFAIAEGILCTYAVVAILVFIRRPGKYLARLPICIASIVALFAASAAIQDMASTSRLDEKERRQHLKQLGSRYGYGSYVGSDGRVHIGIEKAPFVRVRKSKTWFERKVTSFRNGAGAV
ncbi:hypothetical protein K504DRAFT_459953 [Pleomassaria siparia CBS 279.74]|uniref:Uncharacterized protein n=1 Tax=Pleomassaria siparia CBS 279.74 TaxID=1314801 RepID=A0A6G1JZ93_9PLEO|nr:hypothetical protein K504DRAFT_459953 [Pleomassaria siparia CBS 279.74]